MAMRVSRDNSVAITVSADHLLGKYELTVCMITSSDQACNVSISLGHLQRLRVQRIEPNILEIAVLHFVMMEEFVL